MQTSILVLSGGLDSTVSSTIAREETHPLLALTFDYGQRAREREQEAARRASSRLGVPHKIVRLPWLAEITRTSLVNAAIPLPSMREGDLDDPSRNQESARSVWVPNRNGVFLNVAAGFAESLGVELLVTGFNAEEGVTFPDNSLPFVRAANEFFWYSTLSRPKVVSFTQEMDKTAIVRKGRELAVPFREVWFCYEGGDLPCRRCESCLRSFRAFREAGVGDPWAP